MVKSYYSLLLSLFGIIIFSSVINLVSCEKEWWEHATFYQIYPRSFKDSDGDGVGDLNGITSKLDHLHDLGIDTIWMSPMFESPQKDFGYDVSDFLQIHHEYGTMNDFDVFMNRTKELGIGVLLDFVPNHSSNEHEWFKRSVERDGIYTDYYIWDNGKMVDNVRHPPNNWRSVFGGSAWTLHPVRQQYYLHQFYAEQPDLNYRNPLVREEMTKVLEFWLKKGVAGFRVDAINHMFEDVRMLDEPRNDWNNNENSYDWVDHIYTKDQPETYDVIYSWRKLLTDFKVENNVPTKILMTEAYASIEDTMRYYKSDNGTLGAHMPFNFQLIYLNRNELSAQNIKQNIDYWLNYMPPGHTANWVTGSHDHSRVASKIGPNFVPILNTINLMLPGTSITYYGEEIGMTDNLAFPISDSRDPNRTPMQWDSSVSAGFSTSQQTWLPVTSNYLQINVDAAKSQSRSNYHHYIELSKLRNEETTLINGDLHSKTLSRDLLAFTREYPGEKIFLIIVNLATNTQVLDLSLSFYNLPESMEIVSSNPLSPYRIGDTIEPKRLTINSYDALVIVGSGGNILGKSIFALLVILLRSILYQ